MSNTPLANVDMPDPWMFVHEGQYYLTFTLGNRVEIWASPSMENFCDARRSLVWQPSPDSDWSVDIWAPELHLINRTWYIYTAASKPGAGNASHRTIVLRSSDPDPMNASAWNFLGPLQGLPDHWHIDATVFSPRRDEWYCCYSGWPIGDNSDTEQDLVLIKLASPEQAIPETLTTISRPTLSWERPDRGRRGVNEGPTWLSTPWFQGIVFSAHGSWTNEYKLGLLQLTGDDLLREDSWTKRQHPLLISDLSIGPPFGPGHASFVSVGCLENEIYCIYHGAEKADEGWSNRKARVVKLGAEHFQSQGITHCCARGAPSPGRVIGWTPKATFPPGPSAQSSNQNSGVKKKRLTDRLTATITQAFARAQDRIN